MKQIKKIDQYLKGNLSEEEMESITKELVATYYKEEALKTKWKKLLAEDKELMALKQKIKKKELNKSITTPSSANQLSIRKRLIQVIGGIAASALFLLASWFLFQRTTTPAPIRYADKYLAQAYELNQTRKDAGEELRVTANIHYEGKAYTEAIHALEKIEHKIIDDYFMLGYIYLKVEGWESAIANFDKVLAHPSGSKQEEATWFISLALLKNNNWERATQQLEQITARNSWKSTEAKKLLQMLKE